MVYKHCFKILLGLLLTFSGVAQPLALPAHQDENTGRERISLNKGWRFSRSATNNDKLVYDVRSDTPAANQVQVLKPWILPNANPFIKSQANHRKRPSGIAPGGNITFTQTNLNDSSWETVNLPHDWAIKGPFYTGDGAPVTGGMGRLPIQGVAWYRRKLSFTAEDAKRTIYLDIDGAMSYAMIWLNGNLVGGWPYGYTSFRLDLSPFLKPGDNQLAIRLDNPVSSSRWYPGAGIYRNVWLTKVDPVHVAHWGTVVSSRNISTSSAVVDVTVQVENSGKATQTVEVVTDLHELDPETGNPGKKVAQVPGNSVAVSPDQKQTVNSSVTITNPKFWGPPPSQKPNLYVAVTRLLLNDQTIDTYTTEFGIRTLEHNPNKGLVVNGEHIRLQGVNEHHDLGALGGAFNLRAAQRKLEILRDLGVNAIRMSHNPPAPEFLTLIDRAGFLVINEALDSWKSQKTANDYHLLFDDWAEADVRSMLRRDRNHPSVIAWSVGNEVGEQTTGAAGAAIATRLCSIVHEEDSRPCTASKNAARPEMPFPAALDIINLNYQGEGIRDTPPYAGLDGIKTGPSYPAFHSAFPQKMILSSESAAALSTRGTYFFPVTKEYSAPAADAKPDGGGNPNLRQVSAYELYTTPFGASPDKVFATQDLHPFVAGEFVWSGFDYLGEPTPYYSARSSYFGIVDLAGFKKDRFYLYQSRWCPDLKVAHVLPHWTWPERRGQVTPVHVFTNAEEGELFLNGVSQGKRKVAGKSGYRLRWDDVKYEAGELRVVTWKDGTVWAEESVKTAGEATGLALEADRAVIKGDGEDLSYITARVVDEKGGVAPRANNNIVFSVEGPGEIVATDNGDPYDFVSFPSKERKAFGGLALVIVRATGEGKITVTASSKGLSASKVELNAR
ncbi:glycoside hydrolase family 2 protein [Cladorrhinum sp. PSN332]|nr:glycoside hydrolase family 2 protein [Cladorrhinum sp. PSN332]